MKSNTFRHRKRLARSSAKEAGERSVKIAIDLPASLFRKTEKAVSELSTNRSSLVRAALDMFLQKLERDKLEREIADSFSANQDLDRQLLEDFKHVDAIDFDARQL